MAVRRRDVDRLFRLPIEEFVGARNELAAQLKRKGDAESAEAVRKLPKPTVAVWAVNQLADRDKTGVRALLSAGTALRRAQQATLAGHGSGNALREAQSKERAAVQELTQRAREILREANRAASAAILERIARTLGAAAVDDDARDALRAGRLTEEIEPDGFGALAGFDLRASGSPSQRGVRDELAERRAQKEELQRRKRELQQQVRELEAEARNAEREAERAAAVAEQARRSADRAHAAAEQTAAELADL